MLDCSNKFEQSSYRVIEQPPCFLNRVQVTWRFLNRVQVPPCLYVVQVRRSYSTPSNKPFFKLRLSNLNPVQEVRRSYSTPSNKTFFEHSLSNLNPVQEVRTGFLNGVLERSSSKSKQKKVQQLATTPLVPVPERC